MIARGRCGGISATPTIVLLKAPRCARTLPSAAKTVTPGLFFTCHRLDVSGISGASIRNKAAHTTPKVINSVAKRLDKRRAKDRRLTAFTGAFFVGDFLFAEAFFFLGAAKFNQPITQRNCIILNFDPAARA